jgi:hypothetical protein
VWKALIVVCLFMALRCGAYAAEFEIAGIGTRHCSEFVAAHKQSPKESENSYIAWAQGFMSGQNAMIQENSANLSGPPKQLEPKSFDVSQQKDYLISFCLKNPSMTYFNAVANLYVFLGIKEGKGRL